MFAFVETEPIIVIGSFFQLLEMQPVPIVPQRVSEDRYNFSTYF